MKLTLLILLIAISFSLKAQPAELKKFYDEALKAYDQKDYARFYENITEAGKLHPYHQGILYMRARASSLMGKKEEALAHLKKAIEINSSYKLEAVPDFDEIKNTPGFAALLSEQITLKTPVIRSDTAFTLKDRALHAEGLAYDPEQKMFYAGSIHKRKIVTINKKGEVVNYCKAGLEGMTSIFGLKVDVTREFLWACSSPMEEMESYDTTSRSAVFKFDLLSGKLLKKFVMPTGKPDGVFGDLILTKDGSVYVSDSKNNEILKVNEETLMLDVFYTSKEFWNIQGLAFSANEKNLFIADYIKGIFCLNVKSQSLNLIQAPEGYSLKGVDGLYNYKGSLIAIQNGASPNRVTRYFLNGSNTSFTKAEIIDKAHPAFNEPTLGVIDGSTFYYIANSQWGGYDNKHQIKPADELSDIVILKYQLETKR